VLDSAHALANQLSTAKILASCCESQSANRAALVVRHRFGG
jgi:hypothetical protein